MSRTTLCASVAGFALALAASSAVPVFAADAAQPSAGDSSAAPAAQHHPKHHGAKAHKGPHAGMAKMWHDGLMIPGLGPISKSQVEALKLDANQQSLLKQAHDAQADLSKAHREAMTKQRALIDQQLAAGKLDPRALAGAADADRDQFRGQSTQMRDKWLAVWDSLSDAQRTQVSGFIKAREAKMKAIHEGKQGHKGHHHKPAPQASGNTAS